MRMTWYCREPGWLECNCPSASRFPPTRSRIVHVISLRSIIALSLGLVRLRSRGRKPETGAITPLKRQLSGKTADGQGINIYTLMNRNDVEVGTINSGATIV
jgi:hypothetical protein